MFSGTATITTLRIKMATSFPPLDSCTIGIIGLGYVGLPLAVKFATQHKCCRTMTDISRRVIGFDVNHERLSELRCGIDRTNEVSSTELQNASELILSSDVNDLAAVDIFIVTVPTPIDKAKRPDLTPLEKASQTVGLALRARCKSDNNTLPIVIYESTVYPGVTEEICVPILEKASGLIFNRGFTCGYSPERVNPGDKVNCLKSIIKVTSGSDEGTACFVDELYGSIIEAGTHKASSIKVAEAAKVIENTQRDLNIALVNELAIIFSKLNIDTLDVLEAAGSKWNFLPFRPGLVGGHCIGVDPYYLTHKAEQAGYRPEVVLAGRRINDRMGEWIAGRIVIALAQNKVLVGGSKALILGLTFKENCPDLRNTKVIDIIESLREYEITSTVVDPWALREEALKEYGIKLSTSELDYGQFQVLVVAVAHDAFKNMSMDEWADLARGKIVFDVKGIVPLELNPVRL